jgi:membrane dipeptidase
MNKPIFDAHLDLAWNALHWNRDLEQPLEQLRRSETHMTDHVARGRATVSLPELRRAGVAVCLATILVRARPEIHPVDGFDRRDLDYRTQSIAHSIGHGQRAYYRLLERCKQVRLIRTSEELQSHWTAWLQRPGEQRMGLVLAMEGADPISTPNEVELWWSQGLRCAGLAHYGPGPYAAGTGCTGSLTPAGRELLRAFQSLGVIVDLTHCAEPGFFEVLDQFDGPVHASHNMCRSLVPGDRQFSDEQLRRLIERDAVIGMALDNWMLRPGWVTGSTDRQRVSLSNVVDHIERIAGLAGSVRNIGIGSDLDGGFGTEQCPHDLDSIADLQKLGEVVRSRGFGDADVDAIFYGNWLRFFSEALPSTTEV